MVQSHVSYRWTISQRGNFILTKGPPDFNDRKTRDPRDERDNAPIIRNAPRNLA